MPKDRQENAQQGVGYQSQDEQIPEIAIVHERDG
jgi:hypothetical protein